MGILTQGIVLFVLLVLSAFFSAAEVALVSLSDLKVDQLIREKKLSATYIKRLKERPHRMLSTILIGNNVVNIAAASMMTVIAYEIFGNYAVSIATGIMTVLILIFGEITPKAIASSNNILVSQAVSPIIWALSILFSPILKILDLMLKGFFKLFGIKAQAGVITEDEIRSLVTAAEEEGSIREIEKHLIHNIFEFDETTVEEIVTPRNDMVAVEIGAKVSDAIKIIDRSKHSRIPVYEDHKDNVVGIVYLKDLIAAKGRNVSQVMKKPYFVPENKKISDLLRKFQKRKEHMAIVVDEHGLVTGLVTLEDVLEEIVGDIVDESEKVDPAIKKTAKDQWLVKGKTYVETVNEHVQTNIPEGEYETLSGFILDRLGRIPEEGEVIPFGKHYFTVRERKGNRLEVIHVRKGKKR